MQAIQTKYFGPTNSRGSRIKAECATKTIFVPYDYAKDVDENHSAAAALLAKMLGWWARPGIRSGTLKDGSFVHVLVAK